MNAKAQELKAQDAGRQPGRGRTRLPHPAPRRRGRQGRPGRRPTRYTPVPGIPALRQAVADLYGRFYAAARPALETSSSPTAANRSSTTCSWPWWIPGPGPHPRPYWSATRTWSHWPTPEPVIVPAGPEKNFLLDPSDLEKAWTPRPRSSCSTRPPTPRAVHYSQDQLEAIAAWARAPQRVHASPTRSTTAWSSSPPNPAPCPGCGRAPENHRHRGRGVQEHVHDRLARGLGPDPPGPDQGHEQEPGQSTSNVCTPAQHAAVAALNAPGHRREDVRSLPAPPATWPWRPWPPGPV